MVKDQNELLKEIKNERKPILTRLIINGILLFLVMP